MQQIPHTKDIFLAQTQLIDMKVDMAVSKAIASVLTEISSLKSDLKSEIRRETYEVKDVVNQRFFSLGNRMTAVETRLGMGDERKKEIRTKFVDYVFKAGWLFLAAIISFALIHLHLI